MNKKQITGLIISAVVFVFVCSAGVLTKNYSNNQYKAAQKLESIVSNSSLPSQPFVGIVKVQGAIMDLPSSGLFDTSTYNHKNTLKLIDDLKKSNSNKGILLYVDSPGGGVYESDEIYLKLKEYSQETSRPIWAYMASTAASGGFYIAMAADNVYANRNTLTGSIGVIMSTSNYKELMDKIGIKTILFTSGPNKAMGNGGIDMTEEQKNIYQSIVDESYDQFLEIVSEGRSIDIETLKPIADGRVYTAKQALELNLIDDIKTYDETVELFKKEVGENVTFYSPKNSLGEIGSIFSQSQEQTNSEIDAVTNFLNTTGKGVPMYYENMWK